MQSEPREFTNCLRQRPSRTKNAGSNLIPRPSSRICTVNTIPDVLWCETPYRTCERSIRVGEFLTSWSHPGNRSPSVRRACPLLRRSLYSIEFLDIGHEGGAMCEQRTCCGFTLGAARNAYGTLTVTFTVRECKLSDSWGSGRTIGAVCQCALSQIFQESELTRACIDRQVMRFHENIGHPVRVPVCVN